MSWDAAKYFEQLRIGAIICNQKILGKIRTYSSSPFCRTLSPICRKIGTVIGIWRSLRFYSGGWGKQNENYVPRENLINRQVFVPNDPFPLAVPAIFNALGRAISQPRIPEDKCRKVKESINSCVHEWNKLDTFKPSFLRSGLGTTLRRVVRHVEECATSRRIPTLSSS